MAKFDDIKMAELVKAEETAESLVLTFQGGKRVTIRVVDDRLTSEVS